MNILDPQGPIGAADTAILIDSVAIMLAIVLPTIAAIFAFAFWFRASNTKARYLPHWAYSGRIELVVWSIPALTIILLGGVAWIGAHQLDPAKAVEGSAKPLTIQAVSLDWKWLFIYPDQDVATINTLTVPAGVPLRFELTSSSVMNVFFIPQFGSMIYTMNGMATQLNLRADRPGTFEGLSAHFSGDGFSDMHFDVHVVPSEQFSKWAQDASGAEKSLDERSYGEIAKPSMKSQPAIYRLADPQLFHSIVTQKLPPSPGFQAGVKGADLPAGGADVR
ncbi:MAG: cytochrome o ubiquinol oxidase subunit [Bradyrhizobium sp.]|jgi:cytochrome o ubiquinol oxidase subunit 2|nr:cytochrome o ubiquinol oxidase subunit [Bradyrhizobium sp.]MEA2896357.1 cytochrome o ubiquinol oxidase subunit [Bradyrhizobium sp.]